MKATLLRYSLIGAIIWLALFFGAFALAEGNVITDYSMTEVIGYSAMIASLSVIFFALKHQRDRVQGGVLTFGQGVRLGLGLSVIAGLVVAVSDMVYTLVLNPSFFADYAQWQAKELAKKGWSADQIAQHTAQMQAEYTQLGPGGMGAVMFATVFVLGAVITLVAALLLKRTAKPVAA